MQRIAVPMIDGMVLSTLLTVLVIPAVYSLVKGRGLLALGEVQVATSGSDVRESRAAAE